MFAASIEPVKLALLGYKDSIFTPSPKTLSKRFDKAVKRGQTSIAVNTLQKNVLTAEDVEGYLLTAAGKGDVLLLAALVATGVDVNGEYSVGRISNPFGMHETITNALVTSLQGKQEAAANFLLDNGAYANSRTYDRYNGGLTLLQTERTKGTSAFSLAYSAGFNAVADRIAEAMEEAAPTAAPVPAPRATMSI